MFSSMFSMQLGGAALAIINHLYFRRHEPNSLLIPLSVLLIEPLLFVWAFSAPSFSTIALTYLIFFTTLSTSVITYRLSPFHPLAKYPGPSLYKISKLFSAWACWRGDLNIMLKKLHDHYGPIVRTGPNELSIIDVALTRQILGPSGLPKGSYYEARTNPEAPSSLFVLSGDAHAHRRRLWNRAMNTESLKAYHEIIARRASQLVDHLTGTATLTLNTSTHDGTASGSVIDIAAWMGYVTTDIMGDMAFGGGFEMMQATQQVRDAFFPVMESFAKYSTTICQVPWAFRDLSKLPFIAKKSLSMRKMGSELAMRRVKTGSVTRDLWYHLNDEANLEKERPDLLNVVADGALAVVAGSDTTSMSMTSLFYLLLTHPEVYKRLRAEIDTVYPQGDVGSTFSAERHSQLVYLNACINEALRLFPPLPTGGPRQVPLHSGGQMIGEHFLPEGTTVYTPSYARHRCSENFSPAPEGFRPERWLKSNSSSPSIASASARDGIHNEAAFLPFSFGQANCVGKNLARHEMLIIMSTLLQAFDFSLVPSSAEDQDHEAGVARLMGGEWEKTIKDWFITARGQLNVVIRARPDSAVLSG